MRAAFLGDVMLNLDCINRISIESIAGVSVTAFVSSSRCNLLSDRSAPMGGEEEEEEEEEEEGAMFFPSPPPSRLPLLNGADMDQSPQTNGRTTNELLNITRGTERWPWEKRSTL